MVFQYKPEQKANKTNVSPYAIQKNEFSSQPHISATQTTRPHQSCAPTPRNSTKKDSLPWGKLLLGIVAFILLIAIMVNSLIKDANIDVDLTPVAEPASGTILSGSEVYNAAQITIHASSGNSCVVKLKTRSGTERISFYVRAGDTVTVGVPSEYLYVYFATGNTWYGRADLFGSKTKYSMDDDLRYFEKGKSWIYTLYPVSNGNFSQTAIDADKFK